MPRFPPLGVQAVVDGYRDYLDKMGGMSKATSDTHSAIGGLGSISLGGIVSGAGAAVGAVAAIGAAAIAAGTAVGGLLLKVAADAAPLYDIKSAFDGITAAAGKSAGEVLKVWQDAARGTIPAIELMENYNLATQLLGVTLADELPAVLPAIGKVAAATGQSVGQLTNDFIRGIGRESIMILDNLGIVVDLEKIMSEYAGTLGKTTDELTKTERQTALMNAATLALNTNTAAIPDIATTAAGDFARLKTVFKDTKDEVAIALVPALLPLVEQFGALAKEHLPGLVAVITGTVIPAIGEIASWLANNLPGAIATLQTWWAGLQTKVGEAAGFWTTVLQPALERVWSVISEALGPVLENLALIWNTMIVPALKLAWQWFSTYLLPILAAVADVVSAVLGYALKVLWAFIKNDVMPVLKILWQWISEKLGPVFEWLGGLISDIADFIRPVLDAMGQFADLIRGLDVPPGLQGHSPSPFEKTLTGIRDTMREINAMGMPLLSGGRGGPMAAGAAMAGGGAGDTFAPAYNLAIHTSAPREQVAADFGMMQALSRRR